jgi:hypothetical protein
MCRIGHARHPVTAAVVLSNLNLKDRQEIMIKVLVAGLAAIGILLSVYLIMPDGSPEASLVTDPPRENNGMVGRFIDFVAESTWHPTQFLVGFTVFVVVTAGLALYWRGIQD